MNGWIIAAISAAGSTALTLIVKWLFDYFIGLPKKIRQAREEERQEKERLMEDNKLRDEKIARLEEAVDALPVYRQKSKEIQEELKATDREIVNLCGAIRDSVIQNRIEVLDKLQRLEDREKNALRAKILEEHRLYTDDSRNPMKAWSEMEEHSFREIVKDYEALGGNDYVHHVVLPEMNRLYVVKMSDLDGLKKLYDSRKVK